MNHHITDEQIAELHDSMFPAPYDGHANVIRFARAVLALAAPAPQGEPFGFFRATAFGWEQCAEGDEGAIALYTAPAVPSDERAAFEAWAVSVGYHTERDMFQRDKYQSTVTWELWRVWKARAALTAAPTPPAQTGIRAEFVDAHIQRTAQTVGSMVAETADKRGADAVAEFVRQAMQHVLSLIDAFPPAQQPVEFEGRVIVGHSKHRGGWFVYEECVPGEYTPIKGPFASKEEADAAMRDPSALLIHPQPAVPEDVGSGLPSDPVAWRWFNSNGYPVGDWRPLRPGKRSEIESRVADAGGRIEYAYLQASPAVPEDVARDMDSYVAFKLAEAKAPRTQEGASHE